jgi:hypothetical protein
LTGETAANEKYQSFDKKAIIDLNSGDRITEGVDFLCSSPFPDEQKD